jgi:hypothetical protein
MTERHYKLDDLATTANTGCAASPSTNPDEFRRIACAEMTYTHSHASRDTLDKYLPQSMSPDRHHHSINHPMPDGRDIDDTAMVVAEIRADLTAWDTRNNINNTGIAVWNKRDGGYRPRDYQPTARTAAKETQ